MARGQGKGQKHHNNSGATIGFEVQLWAAANALRNHAA